MLYLLHGENTLERREKLDAIVADSGLDPELREVNLTVVEGAVTPGELKQTCRALPFLGAVRVVVVRDALTAARAQELHELASVLEELPESTWLIFDEARTLPERHPFLRAVKNAGGVDAHFPLPKARLLPTWIHRRTGLLGKEIDAPAAAILAQNIGNNLLLLDQELRKLALYVGDRKRITLDDVKQLVPYVHTADVMFRMVDALGYRDRRRAATYLHQLLDVGEHPLGVFGMIVRQFRLLIQVRWLMDRKVPQTTIAERLGLNPFVVGKIYEQAPHFTLTQLHQAYRILASTDLAVKCGEIPIEAALDLLIVRLTSL
mgnify:CR=1 FL=1